MFVLTVREILVLVGGRFCTKGFVIYLLYEFSILKIQVVFWFVKNFRCLIITSRVRGCIYFYDNVMFELCIFVSCVTIYVPRSLLICNTVSTSGCIASMKTLCNFKRMLSYNVFRFYCQFRRSCYKSSAKEKTKIYHCCNDCNALWNSLVMINMTIGCSSWKGGEKK